jgi:hypothetical protein
MRTTLFLVLFLIPLIAAMVSVRDAETRYKRITDKISQGRVK